MVYDSIITAFNSARLANSAFPLLRHLMDANEEVCMWLASVPCSWLCLQSSLALQQTYELLASIVNEPQGLPPVEHPAAHLSNAPILERKYARAYLGHSDSQDAIELRQRIAQGAREALEAQ